MSVLDRAAENGAKNDRAMPKCPGLNAKQLSGNMSTGHHRLKDRKTLSEATAHVATSSKRYKVRPSNGRVDEIHIGNRRAGQDDGSSYFQEWREQGGIVPLPKAKTPMQDRLRIVCVAWIAGEQKEEISDLIKTGIAAIQRTDPKHGAAWRNAMAYAGLYRH